MGDIINDMEYLTLSVNNLEELVKLLKLYEDVFEMEPFKYPSHDYLERLLNNDDIIFVVAKYEGEIIAGLTAYNLASIYYESNEVYVYDLAVHRDFQRKGIGTRLIEEIKRISCSKGDIEVYLQADFEDKYALDFYEKIGGVPEDVIHFSFPCKRNTDS